MIKLVQKNDVLYVSSREVAEKFDKEHKNVLRDIENLEVSDNFRLLNFEQSNYADAQGIQRKMYLMTRDGFSILAFGFIGKEAMKWKEKFLEAFNEIETTIPKLLSEIKELRMKLDAAEQAQIQRDKKLLGAVRKGMVLAPVYQHDQIHDILELKWEMRQKNTIDEISKLKAQMHHIQKTSKGLADKVLQLQSALDDADLKAKNRHLAIIKEKPLC